MAGALRLQSPAHPPGGGLLWRGQAGGSGPTSRRRQARRHLRGRQALRELSRSQFVVETLEPDRVLTTDKIRPPVSYALAQHSLRALKLPLIAIKVHFSFLFLFFLSTGVPSPMFLTQERTRPHQGFYTQVAFKGNKTPFQNVRHY